MLPPKQKEELFSLVSVKSGQPIPEVSRDDPAGFSFGIFQFYLPYLKNPILWAYNGQTFGYTVGWYRRPADDLVVVIAVNGAPAQIDFSPLYKRVLAILEPGSVAEPSPR